jgi:hypothetical protein
VALMGEFGRSSEILDPVVAYTLAVGVEWAYLKGLASDSRAPTRWGTALNWSAFIVVVLWGVLFVASKVGAVDLHARGLGGFLLALAHVVPIAWLSLCSAMTHRAAMTLQASRETQIEDAARERQRQIEDAEQARQMRIREQQDALQLKSAQEAADLAAWEAAQRTKLALELERKTALRSARANTANGGASAASGTATNTSREQLREQVARTLREHPRVNKTELARQLGIGRTLLYELIREIQE